MKVCASYRTADFGMDPYSRELRPLYRPLNPWSCTVSLTQSPARSLHNCVIFNQVPPIQTGKTCRSKLDILFCSKQWAVILTYASVARRVGSFVELKLRLYILRWKGDADFNAACNATWGKKTWAVNTTSYQCLIPYGDISSNLCGSLQRTAVSVSRTWSIK